MRTVLVALVVVPLTLVLGTLVIVAGLLGVKDREGGLYDWARRFWTRTILVTSGVRLRLHHAERMQHRDPCIYVCNHVSWFDVFALASFLPYCKFVGKAELFRIPIFGAAARTMGMIPIERENRKSAFQSYEVAASRVQGGASVVVYPEGTRGWKYELRPFKKGPFVLAAAAQAALVPTIIHGTMHVQSRASFWIQPGAVDIHFLAPIETRGMTYEDRDRLSLECWTSMAAAFREEYGIDSGAYPATRALADPQSVDIR
jgi:1-acyl-sn-glycerol-3-phosphate acyltransferase